MPIITRTAKGKALTFQELDGNFTYLDARISNLTKRPNNQLPFVLAASMSIGQLAAREDAGVVPYDPSNIAHRGRFVGITVQSGISGDTILICIFGVLTIPNWGLVEGTQYMAGLSGNLSEASNGLAFIQIIGRAITSNTFVLSPQAIIRIS